MKIKLLTFFALVAGLLMAGGPTFAHHGSQVSYEMDKPITLKGSVTSFDWQNPHVFLTFDVKEASGTVVAWGAEMADNPRQLAARGWTKDTLKPGSEITVTVFPSKAGTPRGFLSKLTLNDKMIYDNRTQGVQGAAGAEGGQQ